MGQQEIDHKNLQARIQAQGGLQDRQLFDSNKPAPKRRGVDTEVYNECERPEVAAKVSRPDRNTLKKISLEELRPPPTVLPDGVSSMVYRLEAGQVQIENIQFLVAMRPTSDISAWAFLDKATLDKVFDTVMDSIDHIDLLQVVSAPVVDDQGFSFITLNTFNMDIFNTFRAGVRNYSEIPGFTLDTFSKSEFIEKKTATIYVPQRFGRFGARRLFRTLVHVYPGLAARYEIFHRHEFKENIPGRPNHIGDSILVVGGPDFLEKLANYPEKFVFHLNSFWRFTIRGGNRRPTTVTQEDIDRAAFSLEFSREISHTISPSVPTIPSGSTP